MAKSRDNSGLFSVDDLAENTKKNLEKRGEAPKKEVVPEIEHTQDPHTSRLHNTDTQHTYTIPQEETRSKRVQVVIKPSTNKALDALVRQGKIKSKNDLINFLLEDFLKKNA